MHREDDEVVQKPQRLRIIPAHELVDGFDQLVRSEHLGGVQPAVEPHHGLALLRERARLVVGQPIDCREPPRDFLVAIELLEVLGRRDDRHQLRAAFGRLADLDDLHPIGFLVELLPVLDELVVGRELIVVADVEAEELLGSRDPLRGRGGADGDDEREWKKKVTGGAPEHRCPPDGRLTILRSVHPRDILQR